MYIRDFFTRRKFAHAIECDRENRIGGWIFLLDAPARRLLVSLKSGQHVVAMARADVYRADVRRAHPGHDGYCGFSFVIGAHARSDLEVGVVTPKCTVASGPPAGVRRDKEIIRHQDFVLCLERTEARLSGWVISPRDPEKRFRLLIRVAGRLWAEQTACLYRQDVPKPIDDPFHGFSIVLPSLSAGIELINAETGGRLYGAGSRS